MSESPKSTIVVGLGSPLMGDDGLGLVALERLRAEFPSDPSLDWIDGGTAGLALLPALESARRVLLLDAIELGSAPGTRIEIDGPDLPRRLSAKLSPHQVDVAELLALSALRDKEPPVLVAFGIQPASVAFGVGLSEPVSSAMDGLIADAGARLRAWGHLGSVDTAAAAVVGRS